LLAKVGPAIIRNFRIHQDYNDPAILRFLGEPAEGNGGLNTILILGVRTESISGQEYQMFFVQNWTRSKQFIEVSAEYLRKVLLITKPPLAGKPGSSPHLKGAGLP